MGFLIAGILALGVGALHWVFVVRRLWNDERYVERMVRSFSVLPYSPAVGRGAVRGSAALTAMAFSAFVFFAAAGVLELQGGHKGDVASLISLIGVFAFISCFVVHLSLIWFNFPRLFAVPSMRGDIGTVTAAFRRRSSAR